MKVIDIYNNATAPVFSIELSPPLNGTPLEPIFNTVSGLMKYEPAYVSVTCSALGSARGGTIPIAGKIKRDYGVESVVHLTCVAKSQQDIDNMLMDARYEGVQNILALRGDPPKGEKEFRPHEKGHRYASDFVEQINRLNQGKYITFQEGEYRDGEPNDFCVSVAGYPEGHPECPDKEQDLEHLRIKVENGADYIITQLFFDPAVYFKFVDRVSNMGIKAPVVPGVMPVESFAHLDFILKQPIGVSVPQEFIDKLRKFKEDGDTVSAQQYGVEFISTMCKALIDGGAPGIHMYTMNTPHRAARIFDNIVQHRPLADAAVV
ncbi:MAG: methylenetetrahydrofolate reductase [Firmicutes bacterium]|nr:methylenetetrahydrofolate reductase [Bacillota bacterium]